MPDAMGVASGCVVITGSTQYTAVFASSIGPALLLSYTCYSHLYSCSSVKSSLYGVMGQEWQVSPLEAPVPSYCSIYLPLEILTGLLIIDINSTWMGLRQLILSPKHSSHIGGQCRPFHAR